MGRRNSCLDFSISLFEIKSIVECAVIFPLFISTSSWFPAASVELTAAGFFLTLYTFIFSRESSHFSSQQSAPTHNVSIWRKAEMEINIFPISQSVDLSHVKSAQLHSHTASVWQKIWVISLRRLPAFCLTFFRTSLHRLSSRFSSFDLSNISHLFLLLSQIAWFGLWADEKEKRKDRRKMTLSVKKEEKSLNLNTRLSVSLSLCGCAGMDQRALSIFSIKLCGFFHEKSTHWLNRSDSNSLPPTDEWCGMLMRKLRIQQSVWREKKGEERT